MPMTMRITEARSTTSGPRERLLANLPVTERRVEAAGISTAVLEGGHGPPVLVLHGPGEFAARWLRVIPGLVAQYRAVIPDLPGHGTSDAGDGGVDEAHMVEWLDQLIDATCSEPPALVGHILGGAIGMRFAIARPQRLRQLVLVDSLGLAPFRPAPRFALALLGFMALPSRRSYERMMGQCEHDRDAVARAMGADWDSVRDYTIERARDRRAGAAVGSLMRSVGVPAIAPDRLARLAVPTTLIWGRHDRALRVTIAENASTRYGWPLHVIEDTADDAPLERPTPFLETLRRVLDARAASGDSNEERI